MPTTDLKCWNCGHPLIDVPQPISRHEQCAACFEALHCCRLCRYFRADVSARCEEERADPPVIKENANFCDWFKPHAGAFAGSRVEKSGAAADKLNALFAADSGDASGIDSEPAEKSAEARSRLDDLFSKD